jgi:2-hydroxychromene-2-carboxylate isomerase
MLRGADATRSFRGLPAMPAPTIEMLFDCSSPWTYLAFERLVRLVEAERIGVRWRPILVGGIFNTINPSVYASREKPVPAKARYMAKDLADWARHQGLAIKWRPAIFPINSVRAMRGSIVASREDRLVPFARRVFELYWGEDRDITKDEALAEACLAAGLDAKALLAAIETDGVKAQLRANTDELIARGGFGSPTIFLGGDDMYFGNDRMELIEAKVRRP